MSDFLNVSIGGGLKVILTPHYDPDFLFIRKCIKCIVNTQKQPFDFCFFCFFKCKVVRFSVNKAEEIDSVVYNKTIGFI